LRRWIEGTTDDLAGMVTGRVPGESGASLFDGLSSVAAAVRAAEIISYPNPMGLPRPD
jgi:hypothetical protein